MRSTVKLVLGAAALALLAASPASAEPPDRQFAVEKDGTASWTGDEGPGINANYHGNLELVGEVGLDLGPVGPVPVDPPPVGPVDTNAPIREQFPNGVCSEDANSYCDYTLISFTNPVPASDPDGRLSRPAAFALTGAMGDLDLHVYASDAEGTLGERLGQSAGPNGDNTSLDESLSIPVATTAVRENRPGQVDKPTVWLLVEVVYYAAAPGGYDMAVAF